MFNNILRDAKGRFKSLGWLKGKSNTPISQNKVVLKKIFDNASDIYKEPKIPEHINIIDEKFVKVYRGLNPNSIRTNVLGKPEDILDKPSEQINLGIHWTTDFDSAMSFAVKDSKWALEKDFSTKAPSLEDEKWARENDFGIVLMGMVDIDHIIWEGTREWQAVATKKLIFPSSTISGAREKEVTIRSCSPVNILEEYKVDDQGVKESRTFGDGITRNT